MVYKVIVDFTVEQGVLYINLMNMSPEPVFNVKISFNPEFSIHSGKRKVHEMHIFQGIPFLAPGKRFNILVDKFPVYLNRKEPTRFQSVISFLDEYEEVREYELEHNLDIYRNLAELEY